jgi:hypothetical protein
LAIGKFEENITDLVDAEPVVMALKDYTSLSAAESESEDNDAAKWDSAQVQQ